MGLDEIAVMRAEGPVPASSAGAYALTALTDLRSTARLPQLIAAGVCGVGSGGIDGDVPATSAEQGQRAAQLRARCVASNPNARSWGSFRVCFRVFFEFFC